MVDSQEIQNSLFGLVSWRDHYDLTDVPALAANLTVTPRSGLYFQDGNRNVDLFTIKQTIPENMPLNDYLERTTKNGISKVFTRVMTEKKLQESVKSIVERSGLFYGWGNIKDTIINEGKFVGFEIQLLPQDGIKAIIHRLGMQFTQPQIDLKIYVYHTSQEEAVTTVQISTTKANSVNWVGFNQTIRFFDTNVDAGGSYIIGYYQNNIAGQAIKKDFDFLKGPCNTCTNQRHFADAWKIRSDKMIIRPIYVNNADLNSVDLFDLDDVQIDYKNNWGMNLDTSIQCDVTKVISDNENVFAELIRAQVQLDIITDIKNSTRLNSIKDRTLKLILREIEGDKNTNNIGLAKQVDEMIGAAKFDLSNLNPICLPCDYRNSSPRMTSVSMWRPNQY